MTSWATFAREAPELAQLTLARFESTELVMLGTLRANGWPRISPIEYTLFDGDFIVGGMWQSKKCLDLLRDGRCVVHSTTSDKDGKQGDAKLYATARPLEENRVEHYWQHIFEKLNWRPDGPAHAFVLDFESAAYVTFDGPPEAHMRMLTWPGDGKWTVRSD